MPAGKHEDYTHHLSSHMSDARWRTSGRERERERERERGRSIQWSKYISGFGLPAEDDARNGGAGAVRGAVLHGHVPRHHVHLLNVDPPVQGSGYASRYHTRPVFKSSIWAQPLGDLNFQSVCWSEDEQWFCDLRLSLWNVANRKYENWPCNLIPCL